MVGFKDDYEEIDKHCKYNRKVFGEWIFFAFGLEPNSDLDIILGKKEHYMEGSSMKLFALDLLESGETIYRMSEKFRSAGGIAC